MGLIASTSDDRTCKIWQIQTKNLSQSFQQQQPIDITLKSSVSGHTSRIFRCRFADNRLLTAGEDSTVNIWTLDANSAKLERRIDALQGGAIWALDCSKENNALIVGGANSEVVKFSLKLETERVEFIVADECVPKKVAFVASGNLVVVTENGRFYYFVVEDGKWVLVKEHEELRSYALLEVTSCKKLVALAGKNFFFFIELLLNRYSISVPNR